MEEENKNDLLSGFSWEEDSSTFSPIIEEDVIKNVEDLKENTTEDISSENENTQDNKEIEEDIESNDSIYKDLYKDLRDSGIFKHVEIEDGEELDSDRFLELQEEEYEKEINSRLSAWANEELDDDAKAFIKFKKEGGKTEDFFNSYRSFDMPQGNIEDEKYQDSIIRYYLRKEGEDSDDIEGRIEYLTENGRKEKTAKRYEEKLKESLNKEKENLLKEAEQRKLKIKSEEDNFKNTIKNTLVGINEIKGFKIGEKDKNQILNFLTKKEHKISDTKSITGFQKKLSEVFQDADKTILLAQLLSKDFDMSNFEKSIITKNTKKIKTNLEQRKNNNSNTKTPIERGSIADLF